MLEQLLAVRLSVLHVVLITGLGLIVLLSPPLLGSFCTKLLFYPSSEMEPVNDIDGVACQSYFIEYGGNRRLGAWYFDCPGADRVILVSHGNAGNLSHRTALVQLFLRMNHSVLLYDYQGYGESTGKPSPQGILEDGLSAYDFLKEKLGYKTNRIVLYGESLGCAVATHIARERGAAAVVLQSGFSTLPDIARAHFLIFRPWPDWTFYRPHLSNVENVRFIKAPILVMHGEKDDVIPFSQAKEVFASACEPKEFVALPNSGHNGIMNSDPDLYFQSIAKFLKSVPPVKQAAS